MTNEILFLAAMLGFPVLVFVALGLAHIVVTLIKT